MTKQLRNSLLEEAKQGRLYDWLCVNYWKIGNGELVDIAKELAFVIDDREGIYESWTDQQRRDALVAELEDRIEEDEE